ncbi:UNVERIFIED_CONTAM: Tetraspanin-2 [Sesamum indicum]
MCGFQYSSPTTWVGPSNIAAEADCTIWNNDPSQLCYNCDSCKAGLLGNLRHEWRKANIILIITVVVLIWVYLIACSAYRNAQTEELFRRYKQACTILSKVYGLESKRKGLEVECGASTTCSYSCLSC